MGLYRAGNYQHYILYGACGNYLKHEVWDSYVSPTNGRGRFSSPDEIHVCTFWTLECSLHMRDWCNTIFFLIFFCSDSSSYCATITCANISLCLLSSKHSVSQDPIAEWQISTEAVKKFIEIFPMRFFFLLTQTICFKCFLFFLNFIFSSNFLSYGGSVIFFYRFFIFLFYLQIPPFCLSLSGLFACVSVAGNVNIHKCLSLLSIQSIYFFHFYHCLFSPSLFNIPFTQFPF